MATELREMFKQIRGRKLEIPFGYVYVEETRDGAEIRIFVDKKKIQDVAENQYYATVMGILRGVMPPQQPPPT